MRDRAKERSPSPIRRIASRGEKGIVGAVCCFFGVDLLVVVVVVVVDLPVLVDVGGADLDMPFGLEKGIGWARPLVFLGLDFRRLFLPIL